MIQTHAQEMVAIGALKGADYNPREMPEPMMERLVASIVEFGFVEPVVARREDGLVIGGHQRVAASRRHLASQGFKPKDIEKFKIPVIYLDKVDDARAKVLNLALNKIGGEWDYLKLSAMLVELQEVPELKLDLSGFSVPEIEDIVGLMGASSLGLNPSTDPEVELRRDGRRFLFEVETDEQAKFCAGVLREFGMTGPGNSAQAFITALQAAARKGKAAPPAKPVSKAKAKKEARA